MSRHGYDDDCDDHESWLRYVCWRGQVASAMRGKRGQAFLRELLAALDAMPVKRLVASEFERDGEVCALGAVAVARGMPTDELDPDDAEEIGEKFGIANQLAREIMYENDDFRSWGQAS